MKNFYAENPGKVSIVSLKFEYLYIIYNILFYLIVY